MSFWMDFQISAVWDLLPSQDGRSIVWRAGNGPCSRLMEGDVISANERWVTSARRERIVLPGRKVSFAHSLTAPEWKVEQLRAGVETSAASCAFFCAGLTGRTVEGLEWEGEPEPPKEPQELRVSSELGKSRSSSSKPMDPALITLFEITGCFRRKV